MISTPTTAVTAASAMEAGALEARQANARSFTFTLPGEDTFDGHAAVYLELRETGVLGADGLLARVSEADPTGASVTLTFSIEQMNQPVTGDSKDFGLWAYVDEHQLFYEGLLTLYADETAASLTDDPPVVTEINLTRTLADTLYAPIGGGVDLSGYSTTAEMNTAIGTATDGLAPLASPALTGTPTAPTAIPNDSSTQIANTDFVNAALGTALGALTGGGTVIITEPQTLTVTDKDQVLENLGLVNVANIVTLTGAQTLTNKSIDAGQLTGNLANARIATALTTPGPIGGTTPAVGTFTTLIGTSVVQVGTGSGNRWDSVYGNGGANSQMTALAGNQGSGFFVSGGYLAPSDKHIGFAYGSVNTTIEVAFRRNSSTAIEIDNGTAGTYRDLILRCLKYDRTDTATGTTGAQTINKGAGTVNFAAASTSLVVTNSLVTAATKIIATIQTNDTTAKSVSVVAASGSFTLYLNAAATAETAVSWQISG